MGPGQKKTLLKRLAWTAGCLLAGMWLLDVATVRMGLDVASCASDNIGPAYSYFTQFQKENGRDPKDADEFYSYVAKAGGGSECLHRFKTRFAVLPPGVKDPLGRRVLLMCPPGSHGLLRGYAFGMSETRMVRVWRGGGTEFYK